MLQKLLQLPVDILATLIELLPADSRAALSAVSTCSYRVVRCFHLGSRVLGPCTVDFSDPRFRRNFGNWVSNCFFAPVAERGEAAGATLALPAEHVELHGRDVGEAFAAIAVAGACACRLERLCLVEEEWRETLAVRPRIGEGERQQQQQPRPPQHPEPPRRARDSTVGPLQTQLGFLEEVSTLCLAGRRAATILPVVACSGSIATSLRVLKIKSYTAPFPADLWRPVHPDDNERADSGGLVRGANGLGESAGAFSNLEELELTGRNCSDAFRSMWPSCCRSLRSLLLAHNGVGPPRRGERPEARSEGPSFEWDTNPNMLFPRLSSLQLRGAGAALLSRRILRAAGAELRRVCVVDAMGRMGLNTDDIMFCRRIEQLQLDCRDASAALQAVSVVCAPTLTDVSVHSHSPFPCCTDTGIRGDFCALQRLTLWGSGAFGVFQRMAETCRGVLEEVALRELGSGGGGGASLPEDLRLGSPTFPRLTRLRLSGAATDHAAVSPSSSAPPIQAAAWLQAAPPSVPAA
eukprot:GHVU01104039.1.p1 GENE.GHVU01104039.1~~GHVU01104039.1.p1  ORF type:complete len:522 (-),score=55.91 GHVU01104039.1:649-2214(-)